MAAYAALVSLMNTMAQIQIHPRLSTNFDKKHIESLGETVNFLLDFIESYNGGGRTKEVEDLEAKIASAAHAAEDAIESHIVDLIHAGSTKQIGRLLQKMMRRIRKKPVIFDVQKVTENLDSIRKDVAEVEKQGRLKHQTPYAASTSPVSAGKTTIMVGFDDYLLHLLDKLTSQQSHLVVIPIIGMGGVGKTTVARNAFNNLLIKQHFDVRAWTTISQNYSVREILLQLLASLEVSQQFMALDEGQLGEKLHKCLFNRRYLVIMDDMWSIDVWDEIKIFFPDNSNGSRIVVTSRLHNISPHFNSPHLAINLLGEDKSWNLFCQESFGEEGCPAELEEVGKKICENCKGLPLCIVVIAGFLRKSNKALQYWEGVARDTYSTLSSEGENQVMNILSLSYNHLPAHLKPCFLYMGTFAEDEDINVSRLINLWVAEGFLRPDDARSLEEVGEGHLKDLVDRNLILVKQLGNKGKMRVCSIHDILRELCLMVAEKKKCLWVMKSAGTSRDINRKRRILTGSGRMTNSIVSLICRVLHRGFLEVDLRCVNLRLLNYKLKFRFIYYFLDPPDQHIPKKICYLWNLQTVIIEGFGTRFIAPSELWEMIQLRHLKVETLCLPEPPAWNDRIDVVLSNLQTLQIAMNFRLSEEVCKRIPNIKKLDLMYTRLLQICEARTYYCPQILGRFHKLESLTLRCKGPNWRPMMLNMTFLSSLKKLSLCGGGGLYWEDMEIIGSLPYLEVLKLVSFSVIESKEWNPVEGGFCCLKFLQIHVSDLSIWNAEHFHFPVLEKLFLEYLRDFDEIPPGIGEIPTLQIIHVSECSMSCAHSAVKILEEQESLGNDDLQVEVVLFTQELLDMFREELEQEGGFTSKNLHIKVHYPVT